MCVSYQNIVLNLKGLRYAIVVTGSYHGILSKFVPILEYFGVPRYLWFIRNCIIGNCQTPSTYNIFISVRRPELDLPN